MAEDVAGAEGAQDGSSGVEQATQQAREQAGQMAGRIQETARTQIDERSTQAAEKVSSVASDLRSAGDHLREQGNESTANVADQVAERAERAGSYLQEADADRILGDVEDLGRRQPWLVLAGGVALGVAAARFLKASSTQRYQAQSRPALASSTTTRYPSNEGGFETSGHGTATQSLGAPAPTPVATGGAS
jgi:hypothetical protein